MESSLRLSAVRILRLIALKKTDGWYNNGGGDDAYGGFRCFLPVIGRRWVAYLLTPVRMLNSGALRR